MFRLNFSSDQFVRQLKYLGYAPKEEVFLREFAGKNPKASDFKIAGIESQDFFKGVKPSVSRTQVSLVAGKEIEQTQQRGLYFVVNGQGDKDIDVKYGRAFFIEHDLKEGLTRQEQIDLWKKLNLPEPTFQLESRNGIQQYWSSTEQIGLDDWKDLQEDLIALTGSDPTNKNPSRVFRVAGSYHVQKDIDGNFLPDFQCRLINESGVRYSYDQLRAAIPSRKASLPFLTAKEFAGQEAQHRAPKESNRGPIPLVKLLSITHRDFLINGIGEGGRNNGLAEFVRDVIGVENWLLNQGYQYEGTARQLLDQANSRCSPSLDEREIDSIWVSAERSNPTPCLDQDKLQNCFDAWINPKKTKSTKSIYTENKNQVNEGKYKILKKELVPIYIQAPDGVMVPLRDEQGNIIREWKPELNVVIDWLIDTFDSIRANIRTGAIEINGKPIKLDTIQGYIAKNYFVEIKERTLLNSIKSISDEHRYDPVQDFLLDCAAKGNKDHSIFDGLSERLFGQQDPLHDEYLKRFFVACVARAFKPGCDFPQTIILQSYSQGIGKSMFFRTIAGYNEEFFSDSIGSDLLSKDEKLKLYSSWLMELGEADRWTRSSRSHNSSELKNFISATHDQIRAPFSKDTENRGRNFVIVGTTNEPTLLQDSTGNRRYWVIPIKDKINLKFLRENKVNLWAAAFSIFQEFENLEIKTTNDQGKILYPWLLDEQFYELQKDAVQAFLDEDEYKAPLEELLGKDRISVEQCTAYLESLEWLNFNRNGSHKRIARIIRQAGFVPSQKKEFVDIYYGDVPSQKRVPTWVKKTVESLVEPKKMSNLDEKQIFKEILPSKVEPTKVITSSETIKKTLDWAIQEIEELRFKPQGLELKLDEMKEQLNPRDWEIVFDRVSPETRAVFKKTIHPENLKILQINI